MLTSETKVDPVKPHPEEERRPTVGKLTLCSALPAQGLLQNFDAGFIASPSDRNALLKMWQKASEAYGFAGHSLRSYANADDVRVVDGVDPAKIENILRRARQYAPYDSHPVGVYDVRISKLVTPQLSVNAARAQRRANAKPGMSNAELIDVSFQSAGKPDAITRQTLGLAPNGGSVMFTSYDEDIRMHHPPQYRRIPINEKDQESPAFESVCFPVGGGLPFAATFRVQIGQGASRLILSNGIHRVYSLASAGYEWCPLLVCDLIPMELPDPYVELPRDLLLNPNANPPLITDFLDNEVVIPLDYYTILKTVRFNWNIEQYVTVLK
jgi:hypothetical protein